MTSSGDPRAYKIVMLFSLGSQKSSQPTIRLSWSGEWKREKDAESRRGTGASLTIHKPGAQHLKRLWLQAVSERSGQELIDYNRTEEL